IGRCNNYAVLQSIPCSPECKIVRQILLDHPLSYALTATAEYLQQFWKIVLKYPHFTKLIIADLMKKFPSIPPRLEEDCHSINNAILLVSVYTTRNVTVRGMLIPDAFLTEEIHAIDDVVKGERDKELYADKFVASMIHDDVDDSGNKIEPMSHKEHPKHVVDDDDIEEEKKYEKKDDDMGSLEIRTKKMQTPILTPPRSHRIILSSNKNINQELTITVSSSTTNSSKDPHKKKNFPTSTVIFQSEVPALIFKEFDAQAPNIIEELSKQYVQNNVIQVHPTITTSTNTTSSANLKKQLYLKMKRSLQDQANDIALWEVLKRKFEKFSTSNTSCRDDDFHSQHHDDYQDDDAPPEGEKRVKRHMTFKRSKTAKETIIDEDEVSPKDETPELIIEFQNVDKRVPTIFDHARMKATLNDMLSNLFRNAEENPNEPLRYLYNKDLFFLKNGNTKEKKYVLSLQKIHAEPFPEADLEEMMNRWIKVNLTAPTLTFPGIEAHNPYSILDKPNTGLIYLNSKNEKRVMYLVEIVKFCDATLEKVLKEVKLKIFQSEPSKKPPLLDEKMGIICEWKTNSADDEASVIINP
ncbi:hypothetical protein Tco_1277525, partial [Tanacetum coccineum]